MDDGMGKTNNDNEKDKYSNVLISAFTIPSVNSYFNYLHFAIAKRGESSR